MDASWVDDFGNDYIPDPSMSSVENPGTVQNSRQNGNLEAILGSLGQWGAVITSLATGRPLQSTTTPQGGQLVTVAQNPSLVTAQSANSNKMLMIVAVAAVSVAVVLVLKK